MILFFNGEEIDLNDTQQLHDAAEKWAQERIADVKLEDRMQAYEKLLAGTVFMALKLGAFASLVQVKAIKEPHQLASALAEPISNAAMNLGYVVGLNLGSFAYPEEVEVEERQQEIIQ